MGEAEEELLEDIGLKSNVELVSLVEVFVDFDEDFGAQDIILIR